MLEVVTIGETMVGFTPSDGQPLRSALAFQRFVGGAESNVAINLVKLGHSAGWISRLGDDTFGCAILEELRAHVVDVSQVVISPGEPTGIYFKDRSNITDRELVYYRKGSAMSRMQPEQVDEAYISAARLLHITGVTLTLSEECRGTIHRTLELAKSHGVAISFDPNYRPALWSRQEAHREYRRVLPYVDILIPTAEEVPLLMPQIGAMDVDEMPTHTLEQLGVGRIFMKQGERWASFWCEGHTGTVPAIPLDSVIDTVGAGDAFSAGVIAGTLEGLNPEETTRLANALGASATQALGDTEGVPPREVLDAMVRKAYGKLR